jgi:hypothetical protein
MNRAIDAAAAAQTGIGGIDDRIDVERRDVTAYDAQVCVLHSMRLAWRSADVDLNL